MLPITTLLLPLALPQQTAVAPPGLRDDAVTVCFAEGTDPAYVARFLGSHPSLKYETSDRWPGPQGSPLLLTWSLIPDGVTIPGLVGEPTAANNLFTTLDAQYGSRVWIQRIQACFDRWEELSGIDFERVTFGPDEFDDGSFFGADGSATRGDIRIAMHFIDGQPGNNLLAYARRPNQTNPGDIILDSGDLWAGANLDIFLRNVLTHEIGHSIGIEHMCADGVRFIMEPFLILNVDGVRHDDLRAVQRHYGDPNEPDDDYLSATDLGSLPAFLSLGFPVPPPLTGLGPGFSSTLSLDAEGEEDWYRFDVLTPSLFSAAVIPQGFQYDDSDPNPVSGACPTTTHVIDSTFVQDLALELYSSTGAVLASATAAALGKNETIQMPVLLPGTYWLRVFETDLRDDTQLYRLELSARGRRALEALLPLSTVTLTVP